MRVRRIAVTGGPGGGKTTVWRALEKAHGDAVIAVPEVATILFRHVFPQVQSEAERLAVQRSIFVVQRNLESVYEGRARAGQVLLCDRGSPDGGGYWPAGHEAFFAAMRTCWEDELARYEAVLFLETAAARGLCIAHNNRIRSEDAEAAVAIDRRLHAVWSRHPRFIHVPCQDSFRGKVRRGVDALTALLRRVAAPEA